MITEVDPEYYLQPEKLPLQDCLDPAPGEDIEVIKHEFLSNTPGLFNI